MASPTGVSTRFGLLDTRLERVSPGRVSIAVGGWLEVVVTVAGVGDDDFEDEW
jgi:hypothetical protein